MDNGSWQFEVFAAHGKILREQEDKKIQQMLGKSLSKERVIKLLAKMIQEVMDRDLKWEDGKIKFRSFEGIHAASDEFRTIDVTIEV